jgi:hypothetical protein
MARTWTQVFFEADGGAWDKAVSNHGCTNAAHDTFYYINYNLDGVLAWTPGGGGTLTDISGATFAGWTYLYGIAWFNDHLYVAGDEALNTGAIYRWDGGVNWTRVWDMIYGGIQGRFGLGTDTRVFDADNERIAVVASWPGLAPYPANVQLFDSFDAATWVQVTLSGLSNTISLITGRTLNDSMNTLVGQCYSSKELSLPVVNQHTWEHISTPGSALFQEYVGKYGEITWAEYTDPGPGDREFYYSGDWHVADYHDANLDGIAAAYFPRQKSLAINALLGYCGLDWVRCWNNTTQQFEADGEIEQIGGLDSYALVFFRLGSNVYAAVDANHAAAIGLQGFYVYQADLGADVAPGLELELRLIDMTYDSKNLYVTALGDGTLKMYVYDLETLTYQYQVTAGAATFAELDARTRGIFPVMKPGEDIVFVRGRDGNNLKIQYSDDYGVSLADVDDAGWAAAKYACCLLPDPLVPNDFVVVFSDDDIYHSETGGADWEKEADAPVIQREQARDMLYEENLILAGQGAGAGELHFTPNYGDTADDISDAGMGTVNHIERSL